MCARLGPWPLTVIVEDPGAVLDEAERVSVEDWPDCTVAGLKVAVTPDGRPEAVSVTCCAWPEVVFVATVVVTEPPCWTVPEAGFSASEKSSFWPLGVQVGSADWAGTLIASQAAFVLLNRLQVVGSRDLAELRVAVRYFL